MEKTVKSTFTAEIVVEKSRFITFLIPLSNLDQVDDILEYYKNEFKGARHYCYAYRFKGQEKYSDDGEPRNTAGLPLLNVLKKQAINDAFLLTIRYFGGKKLGAGRLLRTYIEAGMSAVNVAEYFKKVPGKQLTLEVPYERFDEIKRQLEQYGEISDIAFQGFIVNVTLTTKARNTLLIENAYNVIKKESIEIYEDI
ncbi:MAG TPA: YigZ family protein [Bacilli bacterium]|nr:YigZ family protein [Bacilli bacterium]